LQQTFTACNAPLLMEISTLSVNNY